MMIMLTMYLLIIQMMHLVISFFHDHTLRYEIASPVTVTEHQASSLVNLGQKKTRVASSRASLII
jgi:hypothetical protein